MPKPKVLSFRKRRITVVVTSIIALIGLVFAHSSSYEKFFEQPANADSTINISSDSGIIENAVVTNDDNNPLAINILAELEIKGRAPKTGYSRDEFYSGWPTVDGCNLRQRILKRELGDTATLAEDGCTVTSGEFYEPYTGSYLVFYQKSDLSTGLQIDHVVALSDAWQKGAQNLNSDERYALATDPLNLLAVDSKANQGKSDGDAATWLPSNKAFRCQYVARQVSVKYKYHLWVTQAEHDAIEKILNTCPNEPTVGITKE